MDVPCSIINDLLTLKKLFIHYAKTKRKSLGIKTENIMKHKEY